MKKKLIILANGRSLRAYRSLTDELAAPVNRLEEIDVDLLPLQPDPADTSDDDGRFPGGTRVKQATAMKHGESHGRKTEKKRRELRKMARYISEIIEQESCNDWNLAIPASMSHQLVTQLPAQMQLNLKQLKLGDYTKLPINKIEPLFL